MADARTSPPSATSGPAGRRRRKSRGAALVELALVLPILIGLFAAVADYGLGFRRTLEVQAASRSGVRVASNLGPARAADQSALLAIKAALAQTNGTFIRIIVYKGSGTSSTVPTSCLNASAPSNPNASGLGGFGVSGSCNIYYPGQINEIASQSAKFTSASSTACDSDDWDRFWCPYSRENRQGATNGPDYIGVYVQYRINWIVDLIPTSGITTDDQIVMRIEPAAS